MNIPSLEQQQNAVPSIVTDDWREAYHKAEAELATAQQAIGMLVTCAPKVVMNPSNLLGMAQEVCDYVATLQLSTLHPIAEAGEVPAGCVRVYAYWAESKYIFWWRLESGVTTHFADIHLLVESKPEALHDGGEALPVADPYAELKAAHADGKVIQSRGRQYAIGARPWSEWTDEPVPDWSLSNDVEYRIKPALDTFEAHGKTWNVFNPGDSGPDDQSRLIEIFTHEGRSDLFPRTARINVWEATKGWRYADEPTPEEPLNGKEWTPEVGDVVMLKSGGPKMTVARVIENSDQSESCLCEWFSEAGEYDAGVISFTSLQSA